MRNLFQKIVLFTGILMLGTFPCIGAKALEDWSLEEVLTRVEEANGGLEAIENVTNARFIGSVEGSQDAYDFLLLKRRPNLMRSRLKQDEKVLETGYDGSVAWRRLEQGGYDKVEQVTDAETIRNIKIEADFDGPLIGDLPQGMERHLKGVERIDRIDYFVIEILTERASALHYIDSRTFRELKLVKTVKQDGKEPLVIVTTFHDLEKYSGIWVSRRVEKESSNGLKETIRIHTIEMNPGILDFSFKMPKERNPVKGN